MDAKRWKEESAVLAQSIIESAAFWAWMDLESEALRFPASRAAADSARHHYEEVSKGGAKRNGK